MDMKAQRSVVSGVQKMTPSEAFVETLVAQGVDTMFGIMGSAFMDAMDKEMARLQEESQKAMDELFVKEQKQMQAKDDGYDRILLLAGRGGKDGAVDGRLLNFTQPKKAKVARKDAADTKDASGTSDEPGGGDATDEPAGSND